VKEIRTCIGYVRVNSLELASKRPDRPRSSAACQVVSSITVVCIRIAPLVLNMPHPDFEDDMLSGQRMIEIQGHGIFVNGMNPKRNERPTWPG
jgi:hypothetical protein